jgi:hypothetical protein
VHSESEHDPNFAMRSNVTVQLDSDDMLPEEDHHSAVYTDEQPLSPKCSPECGSVTATFASPCCTEHYHVRFPETSGCPTTEMI